MSGANNDVLAIIGTTSCGCDNVKSKIKDKKLRLRLWKNGDCFRPLGMSGKQKISDYLINNKINQFEKSKQTVLLADDKIIWLCGHRIDERVKISNTTKKVLSISRFERISLK